MMLLSRKYLVFWVFVAAFFGMIFILLNLKATQIMPSQGGASLSTVCPSVSSQLYPTNSRFIVTKRSGAYTANPDPSCWLQDCKLRNNHKAFRGCSEPTANDWNSLGVISMERYLDGDLRDIPEYNYKSLVDAMWYFKNATAIESTCGQAWLNLGIASMQALLYDDAEKAFGKACEIFGRGADYATAHLFWGLTEESRGKTSQAMEHYEKSRSSPEVEKFFWGVGMTQDRKNGLANYGSFEAPEALRSFATFVYFSPTSIGNWALLLPGTQDWFLENRYIVLRKVIPPFILRAAAKYYRDLITSKVLTLGDTQSRRYVAYNDRIARFIHNQIAQMVRKITAHNARPSYTYFGGYVGGASLKAHTDRNQCEFTISMNVEQHPYNRTWLLSLDKRPLFDRDGRASRPNNVLPDKEEHIADADLYAGDALLFMGRHLVHFRRGSLPEGEWTNQVFMHFVQEDFSGTLN